MDFRALSMEFHGFFMEFCGFELISSSAINYIQKIHGIPWNSVDCSSPWNSMDFHCGRGKESMDKSPWIY